MNPKKPKKGKLVKYLSGFIYIIISVACIAVALTSTIPKEKKKINSNKIINEIITNNIN